MTMRSLLLRNLNKLVVPSLWRAKHDYFPRTLRLHNGEKVYCMAIIKKIVQLVVVVVVDVAEHVIKQPSLKANLYRVFSITLFKPP